MATRLLECRWGKQLVHDTDVWFWNLLSRYGDYNRGEEKLFKQLLTPGMVVLEAGAHVGCHTMTMSQGVGPSGVVIAFEPQMPLFLQLCGTLALNNVKNVTPYCSALGDKIGAIKVPYLDYEKPQNFGGLSLQDVAPDAPAYSVPLITVDSLELPRLDFVKVDVEGFETAVLGGMKQTVARHRPMLYVEVDRNQDEVIAAMRDLDYQVHLHSPYLYSPDNFRGNPDNFCPGYVTKMAWGVPIEITTRTADLP